jgi:hypothetical protein
MHVMERKEIPEEMLKHVFRKSKSNENTVPVNLMSKTLRTYQTETIRPIRVDHTDFSQVAIDIHSFKRTESKNIKNIILLSHV